uniref:SLC2A4 regulator n=1 Tax=Anolis carolinensis TaxID=28377 RepID=A0A803SMJ3_ANOCA
MSIMSGLYTKISSFSSHGNSSSSSSSSSNNNNNTLFFYPTTISPKGLCSLQHNRQFASSSCLNICVQMQAELQSLCYWQKEHCMFFSPSAETRCDAWKEGPAMSSSYSSGSNTSGEWSWDPPSDLSTPSTPSPPLSTDITTSFLSSLQADLEETEASHFLFGDPIPRKRKNSTKVMFKCLWKNCGKVWPLGSFRSDGEEDFYYTELDVNVDSLTDGLSSLTPVSPTSSVPPAFPILEEGPHTLPIPFKPEVSSVPHLSQLTPVTMLSQSAPTSLCHVQSDHAYQVTPSPGMEISISWQQPTFFPPPLPPVLFKNPSVNPHQYFKLDAVPLSRKPRGEAKKCRKVYGMENRNMWCTACRWKKACQRFVD